MPHYLIRFAADENGTATQIEVRAPTAWLAVELNRDRIGAFGVDVFQERKLIAHFNRMPVGHGSVWELITPPKR